jgi:hypothetical protein
MSGTSMTPEVRELEIAQIRESGTEDDKARLNHWLSEEERTGKGIPPILLLRLSSAWVREHTKASMTPTILKSWKDSLSAPVAVWFFHECDVDAIEHAYFLDFDKDIGIRMISKEIISTCYAYRELIGESSKRGTSGIKSGGAGLRL